MGGSGLIGSCRFLRVEAEGRPGLRAVSGVRAPRYEGHAKISPHGPVFDLGFQ